MKEEITPAGKSDIGVSVYEHLDVHEVLDLLVIES